MGNYVFAPWVGEKYLSDGYLGKRILVLGESHYGAENGGSDFTTHVVKYFTGYKEGSEEYQTWMITFSKFVNVFMGKQVDNQTAVDFWNSILFYNYVQKSMEGPRGTAPTAEDFENSRPAFFELLNEYKPDVIIVWGKRLWSNITSLGRQGEELLDGGCGKIYYYQSGDKEIPALCINHPSSQTFGYDFSKYLQAFIDQY